MRHEGDVPAARVAFESYLLRRDRSTFAGSAVASRGPGSSLPAGRVTDGRRPPVTIRKISETIRKKLTVSLDVDQMDSRIAPAVSLEKRGKGRTSVD
jgi:hypothetical protein